MAETHLRPLTMPCNCTEFHRIQSDSHKKVFFFVFFKDVPLTPLHLLIIRRQLGQVAPIAIAKSLTRDRVSDKNFLLCDPNKRLFKRSYHGIVTLLMMMWWYLNILFCFSGRVWLTSASRAPSLRCSLWLSWAGWSETGRRCPLRWILSFTQSIHTLQCKRCSELKL